ncbi:NAD(P)/FAD-dependent oxidoreductase [Algoriphagus hitonicola]|uniref:NAD(P)/FAD-dependent oxidoreductase n=1 Tax=Algoriphagus hitonicola TaxID=435880 RepID=UPI001FE23DF6|nr:NAD(P)/FAD-dependent oxidoreductase [Algoriphagus hitonicola]
MQAKTRVLVIGGGLSGLISASLLAKSGHEVSLFEKKHYPFHRVCGEYISNEVIGFLKREGLFPKHVDSPGIENFEFSDTLGNRTQLKLDLGGFGISRFVLDQWLVDRARAFGVEIIERANVIEVKFDPKEDLFELELASGHRVQGDFVVAAHGKRSKIDKVLNRSFIQKRSPYIGVKYHIKANLDHKVVALHNFEGGYCGVNAIEDQKFNLCYLGSREQLRHFGSIEKMEQEILWKNPLLKAIFNESYFLLERPEVINEINFEPKNPVEDHLLMAGDSAGLITPLCGNGMAMAIHAGKLAAEAIQKGRSRAEVERIYRVNWDREFRRRLWVGRWTQKLFGSPFSSRLAFHILDKSPFLAYKIIKNTHGIPF